MNKDFANMAVENFKNGYSCSESIVKAGADLGLVDKSLIGVATSFSGGMSSGCLCGAVAGAQMIIGSLYGRDKSNNARAVAKAFIDEFKKARPATCCKVLTAKLEFGSPERKSHCVNIVGDCAMILTSLIEKEETAVKN